MGSAYTYYSTVPASTEGVTFGSDELSAEEALRWAIDDMCPMHFEPGQLAITALLSYRMAMLDFHRESKRARFARARDTAPLRPRAL